MTHKQQVYDAVVAYLQQKIEASTGSFEKTRKAAAEAPGRMESRYDSSKVETSWVADHLGTRVLELERDLDAIRRTNVTPSATGRVGALVTLEDMNTKEQTTYFLLPAAGGEDVTVDGHEITIITPASPIGSKLVGKQQGSFVQFNRYMYSIKSIE